jgi:NAD(P)-dependent dehydrogenase (short-subunit alcohol dehydrogenase family)
MGTSVLVAGASRGIGAAIAAGFARDGASRVVLVGRTAADLERVAGEVRGHGARAEVVVADLTDVAAARAAVSGAGRLDAVVVNAGANQPEPFADVTPETFDRLFGLNVRAAFFVAQAAAAALPAGGCIAFVSSQMGHVGAPHRTVYCATKHAIEGLVKAMAVELAPAGVRVVSVAPTFVRTQLTAGWLDDPEVGPRLLEQIPLGRYAETGDVADAVVWACSERARMVTGTSLVVDGGWTAR